jgi:endonuclease YncB( thermonuclease family)
LKRLAIALLTLLAVLPARAEVLTGQAVVVDGDTLRIGTERIRLIGIDAPEAAQLCAAAGGGTWACGESAALILGVLIDGKPVSCGWDVRDQYDRALAMCMNSYGVDLNRRMVEIGYAWAYLSGDYVAAEGEARAAGAGIWQALTQTAADYRRADQAAVVAGQPLPPDPNCVIKGNINAAGDRIFHLPGASGYEETVIRVEQGERWFCSVEEATAAGWRARQ